ncbi:MAG: hypothetical protein LBO69_05430 [Ignavibacteria bacterium]|jgi:hypothetical protein|nr:hypothetical protein [Ignavibacteria bacterium]
MKTTKFGTYIVQEAERLLAAQIIENKGDNSDSQGQIYALWKEYTNHKYFAPTPKKTGPCLAYCAITATVIVDRAVQNYALANNMFSKENPVRDASAANLMKKAESANVRTAGVDSKNKATLDPIPGCMFVVKGAGASGRHAGIVWQVFDDGTFLSIEGNNWAGNKKQVQIKSDDDCTFYSPAKEGLHGFRRKISEIKGLIHTEELMGLDLVEFNPKYSPQLNLSDSDKDLPNGSYCLLDTQDIIVIDGANAPDTSGNTDEMVLRMYKETSLIQGVPNEYLVVGGGVAVLIAMLAVGIKYRS